MSDAGALSGKRIAILVEQEFEDSELAGPRDGLAAAGATVVMVGPVSGVEYRGKRGDTVVTSELAAGAARMKDFDALVIPGGHAPDKMRMRHAMVDLARDAMEAGKPVAAICHGPWTIIEAGVARGRKIASWPSLKTDIRNAGAEWVDKEAVTDGNLVTARKPDDIPAFNRAMIELFSAGVQQKRPAA